MATRSSKLKDRVRAYLDEESQQKITDDLIYLIMNDIQRRIAEDTLCLEDKFNLTVSDGTASYDLTTGGAITRNTESTGEIGGKTEILVNSTNTTFTFDTAFVGEITDYAGDTVPAYKFIIESAYVTDPLIQELVTIVSKSLTQIVLKSASDSTRVSYSIGMSNAYTETVAAGTDTGFYRINFIELPSGNTWQLKEVNRATLTWMKFNASNTPTNIPTHFSVYDDTVEFWYTPDESGTYVVHYYKVPTTSITATVLPETPERFDPIILYGTIAELAPRVEKYNKAEYYEKKYQSELAKAMPKQELTKSQFIKIKDK